MTKSQSISKDEAISLLVDIAMEPEPMTCNIEGTILCNGVDMWTFSCGAGPKRKAGTFLLGMVPKDVARGVNSEDVTDKCKQYVRHSHVLQRVERD
jgi:hypothetical protein